MWFLFSRYARNEVNMWLLWTQNSFIKSCKCTSFNHIGHNGLMVLDYDWKELAAPPDS